MADLLHLVDKPESWTSVGHAGTLDPFASGLLVLGEGRTTALLSCIGLLPKRYVATARLGVETDTQDRTGRVLQRSDAIPHRESVRAALDRFRGPLAQRPPAFSAVKVRGERLYKAARRGENPERAPRPVHVYALDLVEARDEDPGPRDEITLELTVSRGTYVRTLAHDLGEALGCGAHLTALRRVAIGPFRVEQALSPAKEAGHGASCFRERAIPPERALSFLPRIALTPDEANRIRHGVAPIADPDRVLAAPESDPLPPGEPGWPVALLSPDGALTALARPWETQRRGEPMALLRVVVAA